MCSGVQIRRPTQRAGRSMCFHRQRNILVSFLRTLCLPLPGKRSTGHQSSLRHTCTRTGSVHLGNPFGRTSHGPVYCCKVCNQRSSPANRSNARQGKLRNGLWMCPRHGTTTMDLLSQPPCSIRARTSTPRAKHLFLRPRRSKVHRRRARGRWDKPGIVRSLSRQTPGR